MDRKKTDSHMALGQRLPPPEGGRAAPADRMATGKGPLLPEVFISSQAKPAAGKARGGVGIKQEDQASPQFSAPIAAASAVAVFLTLATGMNVFDGWQYTLVFASGPVALFLAMHPRDQARGGPDQPARDWLGKVFSLALGGLFLAGGSLLVGAIVDILAGSPGWMQHPLPIIAIQYVPALYLRIKRRRPLST